MCSYYVYNNYRFHKKKLNSRKTSFLLEIWQFKYIIDYKNCIQ